MNRINWPYSTPGIPDHYFSRSQVPLTKEEVRSLTLAKARLGPGMTVYDVGSGTGTLAVEAARLVAPGQVLAVEVDPEACTLIRENVKRFGLDNVQVVAGRAPAALEGLPLPDRVFIGGSGGHLEEILRTCHEALRPGGIIVLNAVTVETLSTALAFGYHQGYQVEALATNLARLEPAGRYHIWRALNPVYIVQLVKDGHYGQ
ncbi:Cobalamin biosynthesis, precorrin-6Y methyltransferase, CbiT subunit [Moorella glycerini]|uniref:Cobalt-precorrin-6Y C(15)-methyltransferase n=1 Tax=Neomoorella stamsii TaxID=1266720 RepID=A0A9X7J233_9FIRM|nr:MULTISPECIES: precorrin-6Y C5,15-methyltransferase (decarboxylating) subunit CbiT [Moorella]PRR71481.1 putative cobalt-precorrin-6Y C(15)-methyltransferase [Moorella stamsii]CEP68692.1 Cobalamin biosynthesis, precorrin-6Y methyltransferase, CbiT subunit [Moorella glycerini]